MGVAGTGGALPRADYGAIATAICGAAPEIRYVDVPIHLDNFLIGVGAATYAYI